MLRKFLLAVVCAAGFVGVTSHSPAFAAEGDQASLSTEDQAALAAQISAVEQLVIDNADDPAALEAAIEALVTGSQNPALSARAVIAVYDNSTNDAVKAILQKAGMKAAMGRGLGAAIATIGLTDPDLASSLQAMVAASGNEELASAVQAGSETRTASVRNQQQQEEDEGLRDETPENPASAS